MRLDISLQKMGLTYSRQKAKELIKQGHISVNGSICFKPSYLIKDGDDVKIIGETLKYVGRGGLKLEKIIDICRVDLNNKICMDIGASTEDLPIVCCKEARCWFILLMWGSVSFLKN